MIIAPAPTAPARQPSTPGWVMQEIELDLSPIGGMTVQQFADFCGVNEGNAYRFELTADQKLIMAPNLSLSAAAHSVILKALFRWQDESKLGYVYESSMGYTLYGDAVRAPDASWVSDERYSTYPANIDNMFKPGSPDFVVEVRSHSDRLKVLRAKMLEWMANGARLAWLIDPIDGMVLIYREGKSEPESVKDFSATISGESVLPGFRFELNKLLSKI
jgi:Uma2 family endonuclease